MIFTSGPVDRGSLLTWNLAERMGKPVIHVNVTDLTDGAASDRLREWLLRHGIRVLNVAGNRESRVPGLQARVAAILRDTLMSAIPRELHAAEETLPMAAEAAAEYGPEASPTRTTSQRPRPRGKRPEP